MASLRRLPLAAVAALAAFLAPSAHGAVWAGQSGWQWGSPAPQGNTLHAVELDGTRGWAAGDFGTLLRTTDGGATWTGVRTGVAVPLGHIAMPAPGSVVVAGACTLRRSDDDGRTFRRLPWTASDDDCAAPIASLAFPAADVGYLALADGTVLGSGDGGASWQRRAAVPGTRAAGGGAAPTAIAFVTPAVGIAVTDGGLIARTLDGGATWTTVLTGAPALSDLHFPHPLVGYAVGAAGTVLRTTDGGASWTALSAGPVPLDLGAVRCADAATCVIASADGELLLRTADAGTSFGAVAAPIERLDAVALAAPGRAVGVGLGGGVALSDDGGASWRRIGGRILGSFTGIEALSSRTAVAYGYAGALARTDDGGRTWFAVGFPSPSRVRDIAFADARVGYALDVAGRLARTDNGGFTWTTLPAPARQAPRAVHAFGERVVLLAGPRGLLRSVDGGRSFAAVGGRRLAPAAFDRLDAARGAVFAYDAGGRAVAVSGDRGRTWRTVARLPARAGVREYDWISRRSGFALARDGRLYRTADGGRRWRALPATGAGPLEGIAFANTRSGWVRVAGPLGSGMLLHTRDGGRTFRPQVVQRAPLLAVAAPPGRTAYLLGNAVAATAPGFASASSLLWTRTGGDAGRRTRIVLRVRRAGRARRGRAVAVRVSGRLRPAVGGERIAVSLVPLGRRGGRAVAVRADAAGRFALAARLSGPTAVVAHWDGDGERQGAGSRAITVTAR